MEHGAVNIVIVEFDPVQTAGLSAIVEHQGWHVIAEVDRQKDVAPTAQKTAPDVVIVGSVEDPQHPGRERLDSARATREVKESCPRRRS